MIDRITVEIEDFMEDRFSNEAAFCKLCRELEINDIFTGHFDNQIYSLINKLERDIPHYTEKLYNALLVLSPNFKDEINSLFGILSPGAGSGSPENTDFYEREQKVFLDLFHNFGLDNVALNHTGIDPEELTPSEETTLAQETTPQEPTPQASPNPLKSLTLLALHDGPQAAQTIKGIVNGISREDKLSAQGRAFIAHCQFLLELAAAKDKNIFLANADPKKVELVQAFLNEETPGAQEEETDPMKMLSTMAMENSEQAIELIKELTNGMSKQEKASKDGQAFLAHCQFLLELAAAKDKNEFLENADPAMAGLVRMTLK